MQPTVGRIVNYVLPENSSNAGEVRPAIIVRVFDEEVVSLQVFTDGGDDGDQYATGMTRAVFRPHDEISKANGTWHWPIRVPPLPDNPTV